MLTLTLLFSLMAGQPADQADIAQGLTQIEQQLATTWKNGDCDAWAAHLSPDWSVIHITGVVITKPEAVQMCRRPQAPIESLTIDDLSVRSFGDTAIVTGRTTATTGGSNPVTVRLRFTDVFIHRDRRWQMIASQATRLAS